MQITSQQAPLTPLRLFRYQQRCRESKVQRPSPPLVHCIPRPSGQAPTVQVVTYLQHAREGQHQTPSRINQEHANDIQHERQQSIRQQQTPADLV